MRLNQRKAEAFLRLTGVPVLALILLSIGFTAPARSPYLTVSGKEGTILWSSEQDFTTSYQRRFNHGDILVDLETYPGEGTAVFPGGKNEQLVAAYYQQSPYYPLHALPQKGLDDFDVIEQTKAKTKFTTGFDFGGNQVLWQDETIPKVFFSTEANLDINDMPPLGSPWNFMPPVKHGDLLTNTGVVIPNYFLIEPFDLYLDAGLITPVDPAYAWPVSNNTDIGLDAVDVEGISPDGFNELTERMAAASSLPGGNPMNACRLNEQTQAILTGMEFLVFFSFEEADAPSTDPVHKTGYVQKTYYLGPNHRISDPFTLQRLPVGTPVSDDDLLVVKIPYAFYRAPGAVVIGNWPISAEGAIARVGRDNIPALGGGDIGCLFRDTNKNTQTFPLGLDAIDAPLYNYGMLNPIWPLLSAEAGETGEVNTTDSLLGYSPFYLALFSTSITDAAARRTQDGSESILIFPGPGQSPSLFPLSRNGIDECDVLGSDSPPLSGGFPPDGIFRGVELNERLMGAAGGQQHPTVKVGLDGLDVIPPEDAGVFPDPGDVTWKDYNASQPNGYVPDFDMTRGEWMSMSTQYTHAGPVSEADSLWWFSLKYPDKGVVPPTSTPASLVDDLAGRMLTNKFGTQVSDFYDGVSSYLQDNSLQGLLETHWIPRDGAPPTPSDPPMPPMFDQISSEILQCQDVTLLLGFYRVTDVVQLPTMDYQITWMRDGGHYVTCAGVDTDDFLLALSDPFLDYAESAGGGVVRGDNHVHPLGHDDAVSASHDVYRVQESISPGGHYWLPDYPYLIVSPWTVGQNLNRGDGLDTFITILPFGDPRVPALGDVHTEIEAAIGVSPVPPPPPIYWKTYNGHYLPDFDQKQDGWMYPLIPGKWSWCGPVAEANSLWWFDYRFADLVDATTCGPLITELFGLMKTDQGHQGTLVNDYFAGVKQYLGDHNSTDVLEVHWIPYSTGPTMPATPPSFDEVSSEILRCQDVTLLLGFYQVNNVVWEFDPVEQLFGWHITWTRFGGHYVACAGTSDVAHLIAFSDPYLDNVEDNGGVGVVRGTHHNHPTGHNDPDSASHDYYSVQEPSLSPGGKFWLPDYPGQTLLTRFEDLNGGQYQATSWYYGPPAPQPVNIGDIHTECEAAVAVSPLTLPLPVVEAGPPQNVQLGAGNQVVVNLAGSVSDPLGHPTTSTWSVDSKPSAGSVSFFNAADPRTSATIGGQVGVYMLKLTGCNGPYYADDTTTVTVTKAPASAVGVWTRY